MRLSDADARARLLAYVGLGGGVAMVGAGLLRLWGWPAAALFVGGFLMALGFFTAAEAGRRR